MLGARMAETGAARFFEIQKASPRSSNESPKGSKKLSRSSNKSLESPRSPSKSLRRSSKAPKSPTEPPESPKESSRSPKGSGGFGTRTTKKATKKPELQEVAVVRPSTLQALKKNRGIFQSLVVCWVVTPVLPLMLLMLALLAKEAVTDQ